MAARLGFDATVVRIALVISILASGFGLAAYVLGWLFIPPEGDARAIVSRAVRDRRGITLALGLVPLLVIVLLIASALGAGWLSTLAWPIFIAAGGMVLVVRNLEPDERQRVEQLVGPLSHLAAASRRSWQAVALRSGLGVVVVAAGLVLLLRGHRAGLARPLGGMLLLVAGAVIVFGPWWLSIVRDLVDEREARALAEERADMAARLHDSVLQTLALIQRRANDPQQVVTLARAQERELRGWLFGGQPPGTVSGDATSLAAGVAKIQQDVEARFGVTVEAVVVGDCALDDDLRALLDAGREATVNAAKWSGEPVVSLFVEVEAGAVSMYVRDRGKGFAEDEVAPDRRGVADSIRGRMARHGGTADVHSRPGEGTEVTLTIPRRHRS